jgi:hypothetical protein
MTPAVVVTEGGRPHSAEPAVLEPAFVSCEVEYWAGYSRPVLSVAPIVDAVSRQRLTAAPSLSACALFSLPR